MGPFGTQKKDAFWAKCTLHMGSKEKKGENVEYRYSSSKES